MRRLGTIPFIVGALLLTAGAGAQEPTLDRLLGSPFPSDMEASSDGQRVAWVFNHRGVRNIWLAEAPDWRGRALTDWQDDDGQEIAQLRFSPDGTSLAFVRGGPPNRAGEHPSPRSSAAAAERKIWLLGLNGDEPAKALTLGTGPVWHPRDGSLLFLRQGKVWKVTAAGEGPRDQAADPEAEADQLLAVRGSLADLSVSPNGEALAFTSQRGTHAFVGVFDFATGNVRWIDPGVDRDSSPIWSPDSRSIVFLRLPARERQEIFAPRREGQPWSIRRVDLGDTPRTDRAIELFRATPGPGSVFAGLEADQQIFWVGDRVVFPWEKTGWRHLYSIPLTGGEPRQLTAGDGEVEYVAQGVDGRLVFSSNIGDMERRHLSVLRVNPEGRLAATTLTEGRGVENVPVPLAGEAVAFVGATGRRPMQPRIVTERGIVRDLAPEALSVDFPLDRLVEPEAVQWKATDGAVVHGQLFLPATDAGDLKRPAVVFFHGGSRRHMMLGWHYSSYYHRCYAFHQYLASRGYVVLSVNYRSGTGYGRDFREAPDYGATGGAEVRDAIGAGLWLAGRSDVDPGRIGLWGGSYGGYMTAMALTRAPTLFAAGVDIHGVHDWNTTIKNFIPSYEPLRDPERARIAFEASPLAEVERWKAPVLLIHGDDDRNVPFAETVRLVEKLREVGVEHELLVFPDEVHGFLLHESWMRLFDAASGFFNRHLGQDAAASQDREKETAAVH